MIHPSNKAFAQRVYARAEGHLARRGALGWLPPSLPECPGLPGRTRPRRGPEPHGSPREAEGAPGKARESQGGPGRPRLRGQYRDAPDRLPLGGAAAAVAGGQMTRPQGSSAQPRGSSTAAHPRPRRGPSGPRTRAAREAAVVHAREDVGAAVCTRWGSVEAAGVHILQRMQAQRCPHAGNMWTYRRVHCTSISGHVSPPCRVALYHCGLGCRKMWSTEARHLARMTEMPRLKALSRSGRTPDVPTFENVRDVCISRPPKALRPAGPGFAHGSFENGPPQASPAGGVPGRPFSGSPRPRHGRRGLEAAKVSIIAESCANLSKKLRL